MEPGEIPETMTYTILESRQIYSWDVCISSIHVDVPDLCSESIQVIASIYIYICIYRILAQSAQCLPKDAAFAQWSFLSSIYMYTYYDIYI